MATAAVRSAGEEFMASYLAKDRGKDGRFFTSRIPKQAAYGSLVHIPITNWLLKGTRHIFRDRTTPASRLLAILFGLLVVATVQKIMFFMAAAVIAGARTWNQIRATVRAGLYPLMKVILLASPIAAAFASNFLPERAWPNFFEIVNLALNTYGNASVKKIRLAALRKRYFGHTAAKKEEEDESDASSTASIRPTHSPNSPDDPVVRQADVVSSGGIFGPQAPLRAPQRPLKCPRPSYSSDSATDEEENDSDASMVVMTSPYRRSYRRKRYSGSVAERGGDGSDTGRPGIAAEPITARTPYSVDSWETLNMRNDSIDIDREEKGGRSEIDSDTSLDSSTCKTGLYRRRRIRR
ncbi:hypothetical protein BGW36DRAFT_409317 [Talaromyces proteolyticus]|uniref:Uncharacterized protein n=1 Tax=Talaromyces proteolyticus TaxID=1131652 RepID=A0AAD4KP86_9EURO|nr:uncharacterized protein BGW36DRAFT_409317 [Talaromyces proteolyticus]KAH8693663.1 hypothetical protein BGW36DRAFT_409317 [Talaromyces proteolyticus]